MRSYIIIQRPSGRGKTVRIMEYAGERASIVAVIGEIIQRYELEGLQMHILAWDNLMKSLFIETAVKPLGKLATAWGEIKKK